MKPRLPSVGLAAAALVIVSALAVPAWAEKPLPPAFGKELVPEGKTHEPSDPAGASDLEDKKESRERPPGTYQPRGGRGAKVKIQLDGDEDGGGDEASDGGSDPDAGDW